jgi:hypothetical protein
VAFNVRVIVYKGIRNVPQVLNKQYSSDSVFARDEPYMSSQIVVTSGAAAASVPQAADAGSALMVLEIPDGQAVRYEINLSGALASNARVAGTTSPKATGTQIFHWGVGASISLVDAASFP